MDKIGFAEQPYLVYQHLDAGHPHIHIVTTNIQQSGKRISWPTYTALYIKVPAQNQFNNTCE
ncbi:MAG: relaxase/mobilization nuclease domain-containing protein [Chitinophagaceae bacterium]